mmetsp:Transcript_1825/g.5010  ORF Transcript_1825/g.5010 Transcript_1825/m.5010 type:complete len:286 (-) Transcript_1825:578-1435(-)
MHEQFHKAQETCLAPCRRLMEASQEDVLPALLEGRAVLQVHGPTSVMYRREPLVAVRESLGRVRDVPQRGLQSCEWQLRTIARVTQHDRHVVPCRTGRPFVPRRPFVLGAEVPERDGRIVKALRERVVEHAQDGEERLVPQREVRLGVHAVGGVLVPAALHLVPHRRPEEALASGHEEPDRRGLRVPPRQAVDAVGIAPEGGALCDHLLPIVVQGMEQDRRDVQDHSAIARKQGVHQRVLLVLGAVLWPFEWQVVHADVPLHIVYVQKLVVKTALVLLDALHAQL